MNPKVHDLDGFAGRKSTHRTISSSSRLAIAAGLAASLCLTVAPVAPGRADTSTGSVVVNDPNCQSHVLTRNQQDASGIFEPMGFPVTFYGETYDRLIAVAENGNVFLEAYGRPVEPWGKQPSQYHLPATIAPYYADVDTRDPASGQVHWGQTTYDGRQAFCVDWFTRNSDGTTTGVRGNGQGAKENVFQLLLVNKGQGHFDIIFNYESIQWETTTDGYCPQAGFSKGGDFPNDNTQIQGSGTCGALLDSNQTTGLLNNTNQGLSQPDGRWIFSLTQDQPPSGANMSGRVQDAGGGGVANSAVTVCRTRDAAGNTTRGPCRSAVTASDGHYALALLPDGTYSFNVSPPSGSQFRTGTRAPATIANQADLGGQDVILKPPEPLPGGTTIIPRVDGGTSQTPTINWGSATNLKTTEGCPGGTGTWTLTIDRDDVTGLPHTASGPMTEQTVNPGTYVGTIPPQSPRHGAATITITIHCPDGSDHTFAFNLYIDPSGVVMDTKGHLLPGATVILYRSESGANQFTQVPDQSVIMSPGNRTNPDVTDAVGHFGWDVLEGDYKVRAQTPGCTDPNDPSKTFVETGVLPIPPPVFDLELVLQCPSRPSEVFLAFNDPAPSDLSDPCRSGTTFKRNAIGDHDDLTVCTYDEDGDPIATDTFQAHLEWSIDGFNGQPATLGFNPAPPAETSGAAAIALVGVDALSPGDNLVEVDLVSASGTVIDSFVIEKQVRAPTTTRDVVTELTARKKTRFMRGRAKATDAECRAGRTVTLFRRRSGPDPAIGTATTTQSGRWRVRTGRRRGTYYARIAVKTALDTATGDTLSCLADQSRRVRRR